MAFDHRYDVALSFAGEDRVHALALATRLQQAGLRVFFDRFEELWGHDLSERLHEVYDRECRRVVVFVPRVPQSPMDQLRAPGACLARDARRPGVPPALAPG